MLKMCDIVDDLVHEIVLRNLKYVRCLVLGIVNILIIHFFLEVQNTWLIYAN